MTCLFLRELSKISIPEFLQTAGAGVYFHNAHDLVQITPGASSCTLMYWRETCEAIQSHLLMRRLSFKATRSGREAGVVANNMLNLPPAAA